MALRTISNYNVTPGMTIMKYISDGHYYGVVVKVERLGDSEYAWRDDYRFTFADGESIVRPGVTAATIKE